MECRELILVLCDDLGGRDMQEGEEICLYIADSLHCTEDINSTLQSNYIPIFF